MSAGGKRRENWWTCDKETRLIELYKKFQLLWDRNDPAYYNKDQRAQAMEAINDSMDNEFGVVEVKRKIKLLRDHYVKERRKEKISRTSPRAYISGWVHMEHLDFLPVETSSKPSNPYPEVKNEAPDVYPVYLSKHCDLDNNVTNPPDTLEEKGSPRKRPVRHDNPTSNGSPLAAQSPLPTTRSSKTVHYSPASDRTVSEDQFCQQIISELREMNEYKRDLAKVRIWKVLFEVKYMDQKQATGSSEELQ